MASARLLANSLQAPKVGPMTATNMNLLQQGQLCLIGFTTPSMGPDVLWGLVPTPIHPQW